MFSNEKDVGIYLGIFYRWFIYMVSKFMWVWVGSLVEVEGGVFVFFVWGLGFFIVVVGLLG